MCARSLGFTVLFSCFILRVFLCSPRASLRGEGTVSFNLSFLVFVLLCFVCWTVRGRGEGGKLQGVCVCHRKQRKDQGDVDGRKVGETGRKRRAAILIASSTSLSLSQTVLVCLSDNAHSFLLLCDTHPIRRNLIHIAWAKTFPPFPFFLFILSPVFV